MDKILYYYRTVHLRFTSLIYNTLKNINLQTETTSTIIGTAFDLYLPQKEEELYMNNSGMSMLEVLVAMVVLSIGLLGVAPMVVLSVDGNSISQDVMNTSQLAKQKIEYYESLTTPITVPYQSSEETPDGIYTVSTSIADSTIDNTIPGGLLEITVQVAWTDKTNMPRSATYSTYLDKEV